LRDLVSYNEKHNEANKEDNKDGESHNRSWNCGAEGDTQDAKVLQLRGQQQRNLLTTLLLSQGVPMLVAGDEMGHTQRGNNNGYCQDNELSWMDWENVDEDLLDFARGLIKLRADHRVFHRRGWFQGRELHGAAFKDLSWLKPDAEEMSDEDWQMGFAKSLGVFLSGASFQRPGEHGERVKDDSFYVIFNAHHEPVQFTIPAERFGKKWLPVLDTSTDNPPQLRRLRKAPSFAPGGKVDVQGRSVQVLRCVE
jgi:glycogen operon protein